MRVNDFQFFNYPKPISLEQYYSCYQQVLNYLVRNFPACTIYQVGGERIQPGISDVDFLLVNDGTIDGNKLYLREFPLKCRNMEVLVHEPFGIDMTTFKWITRLSTYQLKEVFKGGQKVDTSFILDDQPFYKLIKLAMYVVVNYPMNFTTVIEGRRVNVRRTLAKLKKLIQVDELCKETFNDKGFLDLHFANEIIQLNEGFSAMGKEEIGTELMRLVEKASLEVVHLFELFQEESKHHFGLGLSDSTLTIGNRTTHFTKNWLDNQNKDDNYHLPNNLGVINQLLNNIDSHYLHHIIPANQDIEIAEISELAGAWNNYLNFCNRSSILTLITDMNFSVTGHDSLKYRIYSNLGKVKKLLWNGY